MMKREGDMVTVRVEKYLEQEACRLVRGWVEGYSWSIGYPPPPDFASHNKLLNKYDDIYIFLFMLMYIMFFEI